METTEGRRTLRRYLVIRDGDDLSRFVTLAFFDSYESAMQNSELPETQAIARRVTALADGLAFSDLDVVDEHPSPTPGRGPARCGATGRV